MLNKIKTILMDSFKAVGRGVAKTTKEILMIPVKLVKFIVMMPNTLFKFITKSPVAYYKSFTTDSDVVHFRKAFKLIGVSVFFMAAGRSVELLTSMNPVYMTISILSLFGLITGAVLMASSLTSYFLGMSYRKACRFIAQIQLLLAIPTSIYTFVLYTGTMEDVVFGLIVSSVTSLTLIVMFGYAVIQYKFDEKKEELRYAEFSDGSFSSAPVEDNIALPFRSKFNIAFVVILATIFGVIFRPFMQVGGMMAWQFLYG